MRIEFVNHSSFLLSHGSVGLLCDFWKSGRAFNDGWALLCDTPFDYQDFSRVTHLWLSHEHPDHFSPADIKRIPANLRAQIVVLFQNSADHRVVDFCRKSEFKHVLELAPHERVALSEDCAVTCAPFGALWGDVDSWLLVEMGGIKILNINDCEVHSAGDGAGIRDRCGEIDLLAAQFSYAAWQGNPGDAKRFQQAHDAHIAFFKEKVAVFRPKWVLPFASFVYWCNEDNWYLNERIVRVGEIVAEVEAQGLATPLVLYPGDAWEPGAPINSQPALDRYAEAYSRVASQTGLAPVRSERVEQDELVSAAAKRMATVRGSHHPARVRRYVASRHFDANEDHRPARRARGLRKLWAILRGEVWPVYIHVKDLDRAFKLTIAGGLEPAGLAPAECDLSINSHALHHCFATAFGGETLQVNGRFVETRKGGWQKLFALCYVARRHEQKLEMPPVLAPFSMLRSAVRGLFG